MLAAALLCACTTSSSWKASTAASTARVAKAKTVDAPYEREEVNYATPLGGAAESSDAASSSASAQAASAGTTYGDEGGMQSDAAQHASAAQMPESTAQDGAAGAGSDFEDHAARDEGATSADSAGSTTAGEDARDDALAGTLEDSAGAGSQADAEAGRAESAASSEAGASGQAGDASDASGAMDTSAGDASAGGAALAADTLAGAPDDHGASMHAGDETASGRADSAAQGQTAPQADSTAGAGAATAAADSSLDAAAAAAASQQADAARAQEPLIVGVVEAPGKKATRNEEVIPLTLGGLLPMTLGVDGQGEFDFDRAVLREQVKELLDTLVSRLKGAEYDRIEIVGHTDRIGTEDYNQYLSERRAWAVARYLAKQGVPVTKMQVEGRGMQEPVTGAHECDAKDIDRDQLIVCLQKDRRVVISASIRKVDVNVQ
ncbi:MAG TPA: OmpA family protein [Burkholderiales bacterium]|nr:OmpA family protein [Burkholderiales bacterium]